MSKHKAIDEIAFQAKLNHWDARNKLMLEAVISAMLDVHDHKGVAKLLRQFADQLEEFM